MPKFFIADKNAGGREHAKTAAISMTGDGHKDYKSLQKDPNKKGSPPKVKRNKFKQGYDVSLS